MGQARLTGDFWPTVVEITDYRPVGRLLLAHKLTRTYQGKFFDERIFDVIEINPKLTPADFK